MSMKNYSSHGYLVKASELTKLLPTQFQRQYTAAVEGGDWEKAKGILDDHFPDQLPPVECVFTMSDDAELDDDQLQKGEVYAQFDETDLFKKVPTLPHANLMVEGIKPIFRSWVDYG